MKKQKVIIGSDHAGFALKTFLLNNVNDVEWVDVGCFDNTRTDYPDFAEVVATQVANKTYEKGVLICGSGIGMCIAANKIPGIRAAQIESEVTAKLSREHNDLNILCLGERLIDSEKAKKILQTWLNTNFEGGRHIARIQKISEIEKKAKNT